MMVSTEQNALTCNRLTFSTFVTLWSELLRGQRAGLIIAVLASAISLHEIENLEAADGKFVSLFDGKSFFGWEGDTTNTWRIEKGMITAGSLDEVASRNEFLATNKRFENFELRLKFKITGNHNVNAGVQFRTQRIPNHHEVSGFQADIGPNVDGHLYDESRRQRMLASPDKTTLLKAQKAIAADGWQTYRIRADGVHIQLWLNGVQTVDYVEKDNAIDRDGIIAVQIHGGMKATIYYKDIEIEELPPALKLKPQNIEDANTPTVKVVQGGNPAEDYRHCRRMLVGHGVNQPDPYPGYGGFVGWQSPIVLRDGTMLVGFSSGYWHASPPTAYFEGNPAVMEEWKKIGMPTDIDAPRGGRAELIRSTDGGKTWSKPTVLLDTPWDDRAPNFCQLQDGTILCSLFTYAGPTGTDLARDPDKTTLTGIIRSIDNGFTWEQEPKRLPVPFVFDATDGPIIELQDGSVLICVYGKTVDAQHDMVAFCRSTDSGDTWEFLSTVSADHEMSETAVTQLSDGRLVLIARPEGDIAWSGDGGRSWTKPVPFGIRLFEPRLMTLQDGTLLCLHGSYGADGLRAMFSIDGGETWTCPHEKWGFPVDPSVYGYGQAVELSDGSVWAAYIHTGGHSRKDAKSEALWSIRLRVRPDHDGIDLLPAPGE
jgi:hypothetical protein